MVAYLREVRITKRPGTLADYSRRLDRFARWLVERFGYDPEPARLTRTLLLEFYDSTAVGERKRHLSDGFRASIVTTVQAWWRWAWEHDEWGQWFPRPARVPVPRASKKRVAAATWEEAAAAVLEAWLSAEWRGRMATLCYYTGLRAHSQVLKLEWSDFDLQRRELRVRPELGKTHQERSGRVVPISQHLVDAMAGWGRREGTVVGMRAKTANDSVTRAMWERAGIREEVWRQRPLHAFRKTFITGLRAAGANMDAVRYLVGHELDVTADHYTDVRALGLREAVDLIPPLDQAPVVERLTRAR